MKDGRISRDELIDHPRDAREDLRSMLVSTAEEIEEKV